MIQGRAEAQYSKGPFPYLPKILFNVILTTARIYAENTSFYDTLFIDRRQCPPPCGEVSPIPSINLDSKTECLPVLKCSEN